MERYAPTAKDLASRDVVSRSMTLEIREGRYDRTLIVTLFYLYDTSRPVRRTCIEPSLCQIVSILFNSFIGITTEQ